MRRLAKAIMDELIGSIPESIKLMREAKGLSQRGLASKMPSHVSQATISNWENGKTTVGFIELMTVCVICDKNPADFLCKFNLSKEP